MSNAFQHPHPAAPEFHSRFGGLWIDRHDWRARLAERERLGAVTPDEAASVRTFVDRGFVVMPGAATETAVDAFRQQIADGFRYGNPDLLYQAHGSPVTQALTAPADPQGVRVVDSYLALPSALELFQTRRLLRFLEIIFDDGVMLFQSLSFDKGSQQGLHQDTAYVVIDRPLELAACWIALEDVVPGSGELMYLPGSHRYPDFDFGRGHKHWSGAPEDRAAHDAWSLWIRTEAEARGLKLEHFLAKKGDILIWHADLAHGGAAITNPQASRRSLVGHFCPASRRPNYFDGHPVRPKVLKHGALSYASSHYDLAKLKLRVPLSDA